MALIKAVTGHENVERATAKVFLFHSPNGQQPQRTEKILSLICKEEGGGEIVRQVGSPDFVGAVIGIKPEIGGRWVTTSYEVAEGEVLKIFASKKTRWNGLPSTACRFILIRNEAPYQRVKIKLLGQANTKLKYAEVTGRFDMLTLEEARARGVKVLPQYERFFDPAISASIFEIEVLEKAISVKDKVETVTIETEDGPKVIHQIKRLRAMEL